MKKLLISAALALSAFTANSATFGIHGGTYHFNRSYNYQEVNPGVYFQSDNGIIVGTYRNSYDRTTVYAGFTIETDDRRFALTGMVGTGYKGMCPRFCGVLTPALTPSVRFPLGDSGAALRLSSPSLQGIHASIEYSF